MTTIIARNRELVADRRKIVNFRKIGTVGVRDEPKIYTLPFCHYGLSGFDDSPYISGVMSDFTFKKSIAVIMGLSYLADAPFDKQCSWAYPDDHVNQFLGFLESIETLRNVLGTQLAIELNEASRGAVAMGPFTTVHFDKKEFLRIPPEDTVVTGAGVKMACVLLDHNFSYEEIYKGIAASGIPTGEKIDLLKVDDLEDLFPPISHYGFLFHMSSMMKRALRREVKEGVIEDERREPILRLFAGTVATLLTFGRYKDGKMIFKPNRVFSWNDPEARKRKAYKVACDIVGIEVDENAQPEVK